MGTVVVVIQVIIALGIYNVWLLRFGKATEWRGGTATNMKEEFEALQIPWPRRAQRTRDYLAAMDALWTTEQSEYAGEFCTFPPVRSYPKPVQKPHPPIIFGGESEPALRRAPGRRRSRPG